jgi:hypothetical protein
MTLSHTMELATAVLMGAVWKLTFLTVGPGQPYATGGAIVVAILAILLWECFARLWPSNRRKPPLWGVLAMGIVTVPVMAGGRSWGIDWSGVLGCWVFIICSCMILVGGYRES